MNESQRRKRLAEIAGEEFGTPAPDLSESAGTLSPEARNAVLMQLGQALSGLIYIDQLQALNSALALVISMPAVSADSACQGVDDFAADLKARIVQRWPFMEQLRNAQAVATRMRQEAGNVEGMTEQ